MDGLENLPQEEQSRIRSAEAGRRYRSRNPEKVRESKKRAQKRYSLQRKFNLSLEEYDEMLKEQNGGCALCGFIPSGEDTYRRGKSLAVDHDHATGYVRGLLCDLCNRGIGQLHDDPALLRKAASYIEVAADRHSTDWLTDLERN
jgi:hypothetical protein